MSQAPVADSPIAQRPLVLIHGLLSTPREFGLITHSLRRRGINPLALVVDRYTDGHRFGRSKWQDWLKAAALSLDRVVPAGQQVVLAGLCSGGLLAAALAMQRPDRVSAVALLSPTFKLDGWSLPWSRHFRHLAYGLRFDHLISIAERDPYGVKNAKIRRWLEIEMRRTDQAPSVPATLPLWAIREAERLSAYLCRRLHRFPRRTLVIHAREDEIAKVDTVRGVVGRMTAVDKKLVVLENSYHMITMDNDRDQVTQELASFVHGSAAIQQRPLGAPSQHVHLV